MTLIIGRNVNTNDTVTHDSVALNSSTYTKILDSNNTRIRFEINNPTNRNIRIWFGTVASAVDADSFNLPAKSIYTSPVDNMYIGEIAAISESGTPTIKIIEY